MEVEVEVVVEGLEVGVMKKEIKGFNKIVS